MREKTKKRRWRKKKKKRRMCRVRVGLGHIYLGLLGLFVFAVTTILTKLLHYLLL